MVALMKIAEAMRRGELSRDSALNEALDETQNEALDETQNDALNEALNETLNDALNETSNDTNKQAGLHIYTPSYARHGDAHVVMVKRDLVKYLLATGSGELYEALVGEEGDGYKLCELSHANRLVLNRFFDYTVPRAFGTEVATMGLGDRLGLAASGHIKTVANRDVKPILAQQSIRELDLTGRDYKQVLDAAAFGVFQEGYKGGYGADGDHLKTEEDIRMALELGFTMITLDCSDKINNDAGQWTEAEIEEKYSELTASLRTRYEQTYLSGQFRIGEHVVRFDRLSLMRNVLLYGEAIAFMIDIFEKYIKPAKRDIDFEISIDETLTPTEPSAHYMVANELYEHGVSIFSMAPRFCGEFQKGIDYIGDLAQFEQELAVHAAICDHFGYKLSVHSGSDKFSVFALVAKYTKGRFHLKTAGTNWLEAMRIIADQNPSLYRRMHAYAAQHVKEALAYYHITADFAAIEPLERMSDAELAQYMDDDNARQLIHITYGLLLQAKDEQGQALFKDEFYRTLAEHEGRYEQALMAHIGKHLDLLGK